MNIETEEGWIENILLEMQDISDRFQKAIAKYEYPYVDGADLEDLGMKAATVRVRCYFWDNAGHQTYNAHIELVNLLQQRADLEFIHPKYGVMMGKVEDLDVRHDDRRRTAEVDFTFVRRGFTPIEASVADAVDAVVESVFTESAARQEEVIGEEMTVSGLDTAAELDPDQDLLAQIKGVAVTARAYARQVDSFLGSLDAVAADILQPVDSLVATINYAANIPGRILGTIDRAVERVARLHDGLAGFPDRWQMAVDFHMTRLENDLESMFDDDRHGAKPMLMKQYRTAAARRLALETAAMLAADRDARRLQKLQGKTPAFDILGAYTPAQQPEVAPLNVSQLEATLAAARTRLQASIDEDRSQDSLKEMALQLQLAVDRVKQGAERIVTVEIEATVPLHIVCLRYGLPYTDAERILGHNPGIRNPNSVSGTIRVYGGAA